MGKVNTVRASEYIEGSVFQGVSINRAGNATVSAKERDRVMSYRNIWNAGYTGDTVSTVSGTGPPSLH